MTQGARDGGATTAEQVRNVVLVGPGGAGKTLLVDAVALATGVIGRLGSIESGSTIGDVEEVEKRLGRSVSLWGWSGGGTQKTGVGWAVGFGGGWPGWGPPTCRRWMGRSGST